MGLFYTTVKNTHPKTRYVPKLSKVVEAFPIQPTLPGLNFVTNPTPERIFFENNNRTKLIQLQSDRVGFNWKKQPSTEYGSWVDD